MAFDSLNPRGAFLRGLGVQYVYFPAGLPDNPAAEKKLNFSERPRPAETPGQQNQRWKAPPEGGARKPEGQAQFQKHAPAERIQETSARQTRAPKSFTPVAFEKWPALWQNQFKKTAKGKLVWTYWQLGADLIGLDNEDAASRNGRANFLRGIIQELGQPKGTHTFWPAALPNERGEYTANPEVFWSGVKELGCRAVVILGSAAAVPLLPGKKLQPLDEFIHYGHMVWILRDIEPLLKSPTWRQMTLAFLKNAFRSHLRSW